MNNWRAVSTRRYADIEKLPWKTNSNQIAKKLASNRVFCENGNLLNFPVEWTCLWTSHFGHGWDILQLLLFKIVRLWSVQWDRPIRIESLLLTSVPCLLLAHQVQQLPQERGDPLKQLFELLLSTKHVLSAHLFALDNLFSSLWKTIYASQIKVSRLAQVDDNTDKRRRYTGIACLDLSNQ